MGIQCTYAANGDLTNLIKIMKSKWSAYGYCYDDSEWQNNKSTPLWHAASNGHDTIVNYILSNKHCGQETVISTINAQDSKYGTTALYKAAEHGHFNIIKLLANAKATYQPAKDGSTPLSIAAKYRHFRVVEYLINHYYSVILDKDLQLSLCEAIKNNSDEKKADYTISTNGGNNLLLSIAAQKGHELLVKYFLSDEYKKIDNTDINARSGRNNTTALYEASTYGHFNIVKELLAAGASPNICSNNMTFPLENALKNKHHGIAAYLLLYGAEINAATQKLLIKNKSEITNVILNIGLDENFSKKDDLRTLHVNLLKRIGIILDGKENNVDSCLQAAFFAKRNTFGKTPRVNDGKSCVSHLNTFYKDHLQKHVVSVKPEEKAETAQRNALNITS